MESADPSSSAPRPIPEFGEPVPGVTYRLRPGGYAIVANGAGQIAVVTTARGVHLPGGGQEDGESPAQAAVRETYEECGLRIRVGELVGVADELVFAAGEGADGGPGAGASDGPVRGGPWRKRCWFFMATVESADPAAVAEHAWMWVSFEEAARRFTHGSARWALERVRRGGSSQLGTGSDEG